MPGYKRPNAHHPMSFNAKRVEAVKAGKDSFEVGGESFPVTSKAMMYKPQMNKGPYTMKLGGKSAVRNTPGPFRAEVPYMYNTPNAIKPMMTDSDKVLSEMSINRSLAGRAASGTKKRTMAGRSLKSASKVNVEAPKPSVKTAEKAKPVSIPQTKPKKKRQSFEARSRKHIGAPSKNMGIV